MSAYILVECSRLWYQTMNQIFYNDLLYGHKTMQFVSTLQLSLTEHALPVRDHHQGQVY